MRRWIRALAALFAVSGTASAADAAAEHAKITAYEGTKTCAACHEQQVKDVVTSLHYQHQAPAPFLANARNKNAGMMVTLSAAQHGGRA
jgi:cytochrome c551/c552